MMIYWSGILGVLYIRNKVSGTAFFFFKQKTACEMRISDWSSDVCSSDLWSLAQQSVEKDSTAQFTTVLVENFQEVGIDVHADEAPAALGQPLLVWPVRIIRRLWLRRGQRLSAAQIEREGILIQGKVSEWDSK